MSDSVQPHRRQPIRLPRPWNSQGKNTGVGCHFLLQCMKVKSESPSNPMDCSLPGSAVHGIFQARVLEWGAIAFSDSKPRLTVNIAFTKMMRAAPGGPLNFYGIRVRKSPLFPKSLLSYSTSVSFCSLPTFEFNPFSTSPVGREDVGLLSWL